MKIRAILVDMDGTLLGKSQVAISERNMAAIRSALDKGIHVIPCTGRVFDMLPPQILTQPGLRYFVTSHGARVYDKETGKSVYEDQIPAENAAELMALLEGKGLYNEVAANATIYLEKAVSDQLDISLVPEHHIWYIRDNCHTAVDAPSRYFRENAVGVEKMNIYNIPQPLQQELYDAVTATGAIGHTRPGAGKDLEFLHIGLSKVEAVSMLLDRLGISFAETMAIGDSSSDLELIKACGLGIAMGNAPEDIKAAADYITKSNVEDGFAEAMEKYVLKPRAKDYLICIDSDGCAFDTMEIKHKECFCPSYIHYFGLQAISKYARDAWDFVNLYSKYRGMHRLLVLLKCLELLKDRKEVRQRAFTVPQLPQLREYIAQGNPLSNAGIEAYLKEHPDAEELKTVLAWSNDVNDRISTTVHGVPPFPHVRSCLEKVSQYADIVIVSATQSLALEREWAEHDLLPLISAVKGQEDGTKKEIIASLKSRYPQGHVLMMGDAPGDRDAAKANGVLFYPICPDREAQSWEAFETVMDAFFDGRYAGEMETENIARFEEMLPAEPVWQRV